MYWEFVDFHTGQNQWGSMERRLRLLHDLQAVEIYVSVVETSSITRAAHRHGVTPSMVSKKIADLEGRARITLLHRTTRRITVTELGQQFYLQCLRLLDAAERAEAELRDEELDLGGRLRVAAPTVFAQRQIAPFLSEFAERYPQLQLELVTSARTVNLVEEGMDLSIRILRKEEIGRRDRTLAPNRRVFCAAPSYLERYGEPAHPSELSRHSCLINVATQRSDNWRYQDVDGPRSVRVGGPLVSDNVWTLTQAAEHGMGILLAGTFAVGDSLRTGSLREIFSGRVIQDSIIAAVVPPRDFIPRRVALLIDFLAQSFRSPPVWDRKAKVLHETTEPNC